MRRSSGGGGSYPMSEVTEGLPRRSAAHGMPENAGSSFVSEVRRVTPQERDEWVASGGPPARSNFVPEGCVCFFSLLMLYSYLLMLFITLISRKFIYAVNFTWSLRGLYVHAIAVHNYNLCCIRTSEYMIVLREQVSSLVECLGKLGDTFTQIAIYGSETCQRVIEANKN